MNRFDVTEAIVAAKIAKGLKWADIAKKVGQSKEWTTAALLGQMALTEKQAKTVGKLLGLGKEAVSLLQEVPYKGSLPTAVPIDPLIVELGSGSAPVLGYREGGAAGGAEHRELAPLQRAGEHDRSAARKENIFFHHFAPNS